MHFASNEIERNFEMQLLDLEYEKQLFCRKFLGNISDGFIGFFKGKSRSFFISRLKAYFKLRGSGTKKNRIR